MKYLVCVDGSHSSRLAASKAISMTGEEDTLIFLSVFPPLPIDNSQCSPSKYTLSKMVIEMISGVPDLVDTTEDTIQQIKNSNKKRDMAVKELHYFKEQPIPTQETKYLLVGSEDISESITSVADKFQVDCVVMGSRGMGSIKRLLLGSVSSQVLQMSHCSVMIVR
ncbi:hypothetical protein DFA_05522 [Cavenderia fasciculata]|uniref:UspA domain-containing protein n=1 Tax=Cavenderia fasciculata TaxID=261658 RepID=F4PLG8_CACFS|nr:uncharacterized protein DFA_05522 [Cavenderia fasciculata]EGG23390.1 hypothetical protein DFA_05522 [Cavenderia fasciculata]|eukprot:XP_004361241.1 hypothetical protein DFA_05522 [Cavenderia fasciculata]